jgi:hypothetical protein
MFREIAQADPGLDRERRETLVEERREGFADGRFDEPMQRLSGEQIGYLFALDLHLEPDWTLLFSDQPLVRTPEERAAAGYPDPPGVATEADRLDADVPGAPMPGCGPRTGETAEAGTPEPQPAAGRGPSWTVARRCTALVSVPLCRAGRGGCVPGACSERPRSAVTRHVRHHPRV